MSRTILSRLGKLETAAAAGRSNRTVHRIIAHSREEADAKLAELVAAGEADPDDHFILRIITGVPRSNGSIVQ